MEIIASDLIELRERDANSYCTDVENKMIKLGLPLKDCSINNRFVNAKDRGYITREYCFKNCRLSCLTEKD